MEDTSFETTEMFVEQNGCTYKIIVCFKLKKINNANNESCRILEFDVRFGYKFRSLKIVCLLILSIKKRGCKM